MRSFDASQTAADVVPLEVLRSLDELVGDYLLVGARARDLIAHCVARLPLGRVTHDVDISIAVADQAELRDLRIIVQSRRRGLVRFRIGDTPVDLLPYGGIASQGIVEPEEGVLVDVTGMRQARACALHVLVAHGQSVNCASLAAMILLKLVAWDMRRGDTHKDAQDLALLFDASYSGPYEDPCWQDAAAALYGYDLFVVGPYLQGRAIGRDFDHVSTARVLPVLEDASRREQLAARMPSGVAPRSVQLGAVAAGIRGL